MAEGKGHQKTKLVEGRRLRRSFEGVDVNI